MNYAINIVLVCLITLQGCSSQKKLESSAPFEVENATCQQWVGGKEASGSGFKLQIAVSGNIDSIDFREIFFRGAIMEIQIEQDDRSLTLAGNYFMEKVNKPDIIMHADPKKEAGNQPPRLDVKAKDFPFELMPDEAVISFTKNGSDKLRYFKIGGIADKPSRIYPGRPQN